MSSEAETQFRTAVNDTLKTVFKTLDKHAEEAKAVDKKLSELENKDTILDLKFDNMLDTINRNTNETHRLITKLEKSHALEKIRREDKAREEQNDRARENVKREDRRREFVWKLAFWGVTSILAGTLYKIWM